MNRLTCVLSSAVLCMVSSAPAATLFFDFGEAQQPTASNYNNVTQAQLPIFNATDSTGAGTGISLITAGFNPGSNQNGTTAPTGAASIFDPQATRDNLFGHTVNFNQPAPLPLGELVLGGLDASGATTYRFTFFAARIGATDNRETKYDVTGLNNGVGLLNATNNTSNVAIVGGIVPSATGEVVVLVSPGPNNTNTSGFFFLGALRVESTVIPEPTSAALGLVSWIVMGWSRRGGRS